MRGSSLKYLSKEGLKNVWTNRLMSFASIGVLTACLLLVGFAVLFTANIDSMIGFVEQQSDIVIFIKDDATDEQIQEMRDALEEMDQVQSVTYINKEQALVEYKQQLGDPTLLEGIADDNFLPASFRISANDLGSIDQVLDTAKNFSIFESCKAPTNVADTIHSLKNTVTAFGIGCTLVLVVVSLVIIANTIRATVFSRRTEIGIMKQVGATNNFIRVPFLFEGMILGLISAVIAFVIIWLGYASVLNALMGNASVFLQSMYQSIIPFKNVAFRLAAWFVLAGIATGATGSVLSLRQHLKV